ncbi:MAG: exodeoxyribonuclease VII large subunit [Paludibacteraceae bacterium]|nr:exodeoxyribonuclease VII large subunit [Paludibacteraceae bacterium]
MKSYSLAELCAQISNALDRSFPETYWVRCEIASLSEKSGHLYMDLVEKGQRGLFVARQRATCWNGRQQMLRAYFEQETGNRLQVGMQVLLEVEVRFHAVYGLSLDVQNIDPQYTLGDLARQRQETIARLQEEGIFDMQRMLSLPTLTRRLAVVSAGDAAGYGDFVHQLEESAYCFSPTLFPAAMQGDRAAHSIVSALDAIAAVEEEFDAVVIIRGGGANSDLTCFDDYTLAAHCAQFPLPILAGIGHTRDVSIVDMVAYQSLKTPTAVAAFLVERMDEQAARIEQWQQRLQQTALRQILLRQHRVEQAEQRLTNSLRMMVLRQNSRIAMLGQQIETVNPERIYRLGYSLLRKEGKAVKSTQGLLTGDLLTAELADGTITVTIQ